MLVTRPRDLPEQSHWSLPNHSRTLLHSTSPRMSSEKQSLPLPVEPDWHGQYSYPAQVENDAYPRAFTETRDHSEQNSGRLTANLGLGVTQPRAIKEESHSREAASSNMLHLSPQRNVSSSSTFGPSSIPKFPNFASSHGPGAEHFAYPKSGESTGSYYRNPGEQAPLNEPNQSDRDEKEQTMSQEGDYDVDDEEGDEAAEDGNTHRQTVAERLAARRKMKRFRLTHQQTRFLMSEFAKQPHPDAAHRERLSREIPGLSPRQVQVWFQNRRAKIKRLTADDRDRMIRMRAVPDDFDNVQALHSPYGAVHGIPPNVSPPNVGPVASSYRPHGARPILLDMRRPGPETYMSPTGLSHSFGGIDLGQPGAMGGSDITSSPNPMYQDRYAPSTSSPTTSGLGYRSPSTYWNSPTSNMDNSSQSGRPGVRDGHAMPNRDWNPRTVPEAAPTPLGIYQPADPAAEPAERQISYTHGQYGAPPNASYGGLEPQAYPGNPELQGSTPGGNRAVDDATAQHRVRSPTAGSAGPLPMEFGIRDPYRPVSMTSAPHQLQDRSQVLPSLRSNMSSPSNFSKGPLSAPLEMPPDRSFHSSGDKEDYSAPQLSAPISAPSEFTRPFPTPASSRNASSGPLKDLFGHGVL